MKGTYLTFSLAEQSYGLEIKHVIEIIRLQQITKVPDVPGYVKGVINLRGKVVPVMDFRARFNIQEHDYHDRTCIIVVSVDTTNIGLIVDRMKEVIEIPDKRIQSPPASGKDKHKRFIKGFGNMDDEVHIIIDVEKVVFTGEEE